MNAGVGMSTTADGRKRELVATLLVLGIAVVAVVGVVLIRGLTDRSAERAGPKVVAGHVIPGTGAFRTLELRAQSDQVSAANGPLVGVLVQGSMPNEPTVATVMTDENCDPDGAGISHCLNRLQLDDGSMIMVRHDHRMTDVPCLSPNERVVIEP
jgi:hypothetical protein